MNTLAKNSGSFAQSDTSILIAIGQRLSQQRIALGLTQRELSQRAAVSKRTLENVEAGSSTHLINFIRILRELGMLDAFVSAIPEVEISPVLLLRLKGKVRKRASKKQRLELETPSWNWGKKK